MPFAVGDTKKYNLNADLDGVAWQLAGATVTLYLRDPSGNVTNYPATISSNNNAYYNDAPSHLSVAGQWQRWWVVVQDSNQQTSPVITFTVG